MFGFLKNLFGAAPETNPKADTPVELVPYKVEAPKVVDLKETPIFVDKVVADSSQPSEKPSKNRSKKSPNSDAKKAPAKKHTAKKAPARKKPGK
jgi:hypothetical protein